MRSANPFVEPEEGNAHGLNTINYAVPACHCIVSTWGHCNKDANENQIFHRLYLKEIIKKFQTKAKGALSLITAQRPHTGWRCSFILLHALSSN